MLVLEEKLLTKYKSQKGPTLVFVEGLSRLLYTCQRECSMVLATYLLPESVSLPILGDTHVCS